MCVSQSRWTGWRGRSLPAHILLLLLFLSSTPPFAQGVLHIPKDLPQPPVLTEMPKSATVYTPEDIVLACEASGDPSPTFRWVKDEEPFGSERQDSGTLTAEDEDVDGDEPLSVYQGIYRCYASNALGTAVTPPARVIVEAQPILVKQQKVRKKATEGESIVLSCNPPKSTVPPHIHWMDRKMVHIQQSSRVMVGLDGGLYFSNLLRTDSRDDYTCNAQYTAARSVLPTTTASITVQPSNDVHGRKPHLFRPIGPHTSLLALRNTSVTLECIPKGLPTPVVSWRRKDSSLAETSGRSDLQSHDRWLHFESVEQRDDGEYECTATNEHGSVSHSFTLTVEAAPSWLKQPEDLMYAPGETVRLECQADGFPSPTITWSINGQPITEVDEDPRRSIIQDALILRDVNFGDTAVYQCEASNKHGSILLNTNLYVVELPPQILTSDGVVYRVTEGGEVMLHCNSFGSPKPHVTWEREDRQPLLSDPRVSPLINGTMWLFGAEHEDTGEFRCSVENSNVSITAYLEVYNRTAILTRPQHVRVLRGGSAHLDCGFYKDPQLVEHQVVWRRDGKKILETPTDDKYTMFENGTLKVTNIQSEDSTHYSCEVITDLDHAKASGSITVVARPDPPKDLTISDVEDYSLTLSWIPGPAHNSPITEFVVEAQEEQHSEEGRWRWEEWTRVSGDVNFVELTQTPYCTYRFRVVAVNQLGRSDPSRPSTHHSTPPAIPDKNPSGVRSESTDPKTLVITWDEMDKLSHNGRDFQYRVFWRESGQADGRWNYVDVRSPPLVVNTTEAFTPYDIKVQAVNSLGGAPDPNPTVGHSGEEEPSEAPTGVSTTVMNSTVRVQWNEAHNVRGVLLGYKIHVRRLGSVGSRVRKSLGSLGSPGSPGSQVRGSPGSRVRRSLGSLHQDQDQDRVERVAERDRLVVVLGNKTSEEVSGLQLYSRYQITVSAFNSKGAGPHSTPHHFQTPEGVPGRPASLRFESPSDSSLILYWTPPEVTNGVLLGYIVQYQEEVESGGRPLQMVMISDPSVTHMELDPLDPSSSYIFKVIARTAAGDGPPAEARGATLLDGAPPSHINIVSSNTSLNLSWVPGERLRNHGFTVQYRRKSPGASSKWLHSEVVNSSQGFFSLTGLQPGSQYLLKIVHDNETHWNNVTWTIGPVPSVMPGGFATQGWLIGLVSAIVLLVLILLILCLIKRSKGGKYAVKDKEDKEVDSEARPMKDETFGEYRSLESDGDEKRSDSQPSLCGESKLGSDDSLAEYGDSVDIQFNEDGSFIGQYSGRGPAPHGNESSGPASPVNAAPPPPIAPSMSSILNRPS